MRRRNIGALALFVLPLLLDHSLVLHAPTDGSTPLPLCALVNLMPALDPLGWQRPHQNSHHSAEDRTRGA